MYYAAVHASTQKRHGARFSSAAQPGAERRGKLADPALGDDDSAPHERPNHECRTLSVAFLSTSASI